MTQKPSVIANFPNIINRADSMTIEFRFNPVFAPLMLFDFVISSFLALAAIIFVPNIQLLVILMIIFYGLSFLQYFNSHHLIKKIIIEQDTIEFKYFGFSVKQEFLRSPYEVNFAVKPIGEKLKIEVLNNPFILNNPHDLPTITDKISILLNLEFIETVSLSRGKEVLVYRRK